MTFKETVLIEFMGSDQVSPVINRVNKAFEALGKNNQIKKLQNNLKSYIMDVDKWQRQINNIEKTSPSLKVDTNFQQILKDVEKLQAGLKASEEHFKKYEKFWDKSKYSDVRRQDQAGFMREAFQRGKENWGLYGKLNDIFTDKGIPKSDEALKSTITKDLVETPNLKEQSTSDSYKKEKKEDSKQSEKISESTQPLEKSTQLIKSFNTVIGTVISTLEKFNQSLKGATNTGKDSKNKGGGNGGNGGNGGGKSSGGSRDSVPSDRFTQSHNFDDYKSGIGSNAYNEYIQSQRANRIGADDGRTPSSLSGEALNKAAEYNKITNSLVSGSHGVVSAVNEMARANEKYTTNVKNATKETDLSGNAQLTVQQKVANAVKQVTDLQNSNGVTPSNVTGGMFNAISSHSRSYEDMKGSMADLHSGKDTLQLGEEAIAKRKASEALKVNESNINVKSNIPNVNDQISSLKKNISTITPSKISVESNIPNVNAQLGSLKKDFAKKEPTKRLDVTFDKVKLASSQLKLLSTDIDKVKAQSKISVDVDTKGASSNVQNVAQSFGMLGSSLQMATGALTQFLSIVGSGNMMGDMLQYASLRQTNQVMLTARRGRKEAEEMYDSIQQLVIRLPGNDTFMTQILTMLGTMDKSLSTGDLNTIGNTISDYYMAAKAKGQFNNETERELRNYLMTGETRNLTNSVLASEIESLKDLDNIMDRTDALQKAMQKTGLDSIAHYNTYANKLEEFTGRFQKAFADMGDYIIMLVQPLMELFNLIDDLTHSGASIIVLSFIGAILLMVSAVTIAGLGVQALIYSIEGLAAGYTLLSNVREKGLWIGVLETAQIDNESKAKLLNYTVTLASIRAKTWETLVKTKDMIATFLLGEAIVTENRTILNGTVVETERTVARNGGIISKIRSAWASSNEALAHFYNSIAVWDETVAITYNETNTAVLTRTKNLNIIATLRNAYAQMTSAYSNIVEAVTKEEGVIATLKSTYATISETASKLWNVGVTWLTTDATLSEAIAKIFGADATLVLAGATAILDVVMSPIVLTILTIVGAVLVLIAVFETLGQAFGWWNDIGGMFDAITNGLGRIWDAFMNSEPVQEIITAFQNFAYTIETLFNFIGSIGGGLWELIFGVDNGESGGAFDIVGLLLEVVGAVGNFLYQISPLKIIVDIFNAIGSAIAWVLETWNNFVDSAEMQGLIKAFQDARLIIGEAFGEISEAFGEVWDALAPIGEALSSIFNDGSTEEATNDTNILLDVLKVFASVITTIVVPAVQVLVFPLRVVAEVIRTIADVISWVIGLFSNPGEYIGNLTNTIVTEFANIPRRLIGMFLGLPGQLFGGLVDGVLNILGIHSPGYIQEAVVDEFLGIPSRILGGIGNVVGAVGNFASAIWSGFDSIFGTDISGTIDGFINRLNSSFNKLKEGDIIGAVKDFGDNFLNTLDGIFGTDISGMVGGFFNQINDNWNKLSQGDFLGALKGTGDWYNDSIKRFTGVDLNSLFNNGILGEKFNNADLEEQLKVYNDPSSYQKVGLMQNPQNLITGQTLTQNYNNATTHSPTIVNNNFGEGSVQADARNMSSKDVQKMFTGAFGYNKARGTGGILK